MPYNVIFYFRLSYFHISNSVYFLLSISVLSFYIDVVLNRRSLDTFYTKTALEATPYLNLSLLEPFPFLKLCIQRYGTCADTVERHC